MNNIRKLKHIRRGQVVFECKRIVNLIKVTDTVLNVHVALPDKVCRFALEYTFESDRIDDERLFRSIIDYYNELQCNKKGVKFREVRTNTSFE